MNFLDYIPILLGVISTLGVGTVIAQYLLGGQQRREIRSRVLSALEATEDARFADAETTYKTFRNAIQQLETTALIARVPRKVVTDYVFLASIAWRLSDASWQDNQDPEEGGGGIPWTFSGEVIGAASDLARCIWHPWFGWFGHTRTKRRSNVAASADRGIRQAIETSQDPLRNKYRPKRELQKRTKAQEPRTARDS